MQESFGPVIELAAVMAGLDRPWFISGGWAIDLFVGRVTREHEDIEVGGFFPDQAAIRRHLSDWDLFQPDDHEWVPLPPDVDVRLPEFQIQARSSTRPPHAFDVFLNPRDGDEWVSRRHPLLRAAVDAIASRSTGTRDEPAGIPFLVPEIQLLYKAKNHRPKDDADVAVALQLLDSRRRAWLRDALETYHPGDPWLADLGGNDGD